VEQIRDVVRHDRLSMRDSLSINQSIPRKFIRLPRGGYITRSRDPEGCLLQAFTAFRLSIKDKVPWLPLFAVHLILIAHSGVETLTRPASADGIVYTVCVRYDKRTREREGCAGTLLSSVTFARDVSPRIGQRKRNFERLLI